MDTKRGLQFSVLLWSITSALAGFLFGFDTVVISGAERDIQAVWQISAQLHGFIIASALYGTVLGSALGAWPADRWGRRPTLLLIGVVYLVGAMGGAYAPNPWIFVVARAIGGVGIGMSTVVAPLYISEIAPASWRGRLTGMFQFNIVFGIVIAYVSNAWLRGMGADAWRWMIGIAGIPSAIYTLMCFLIPESPRWLLTRGNNRAAALAGMRRLEPQTSAADLETKADEILRSEAQKLEQRRFWSKSLLRPISLAIAIAFFNQMSGINAILYFAPRIFALTGMGENAALLQSVGIGVTNLVFTFVGLWLIDRLGRRTLLLIGSVGYIASLGGAALAFQTATYQWVPFCIFAFIAAHAVGQGATIWVYISEIFPTRFRADGQALGSLTHWLMAALLTTVFPIVVTSYAPSQVFAFFALMMIGQLIWVTTTVIETRGLSLEAVDRRISMH